MYIRTQRKSRRGAPEEAVIAMTGIKEAAKNEWTSQRQMLHQPGLHLYMVHGGRYMVRVPQYRVGVSRQYRLDL